MCVFVCVSKRGSQRFCFVTVTGIIWYRSLRPRKANGRGLELNCTYTTTTHSSPNICPGTFRFIIYYLHNRTTLKLGLWEENEEEDLNRPLDCGLYPYCAWSNSGKWPKVFCLKVHSSSKRGSMCLLQLYRSTKKGDFFFILM